jgi:hypothetical protein
MGNSLFAIALLAGSGLLALWLDARAPRLAPATLKPIVLHGVLAFVATQLIPGGVDTVTGKLLVVFGMALPALVYLLLVTIWFIRHAQSAIGAGSR